MNGIKLRKKRIMNFFGVMVCVYPPYDRYFQKTPYIIRIQKEKGKVLRYEVWFVSYIYKIRGYQETMTGTGTPEFRKI